MRRNLPSHLTDLIKNPYKTYIAINNIKFLVLNGQKDIIVGLRGQPKVDCIYAVCRLNLYKNKWDLNGAYQQDSIVNQHNWHLCLEGVNENWNTLFLHSRSEGWFWIEAHNNNFIGDNSYTPWCGKNKCDFSSPKTPSDIDTVFVYEYL